MLGNDCFHITSMWNIIFSLAQIHQDLSLVRSKSGCFLSRWSTGWSLCRSHEAEKGYSRQPRLAHSDDIKSNIFLVLIDHHRRHDSESATHAVTASSPSADLFELSDSTPSSERRYQAPDVACHSIPAITTLFILHSPRR